MAKILVNNEGASFEKEYKRFEKTVAKEGILSSSKRQGSFMSKSEKRRIKSKKAQARARRLARRSKLTEKPDDKRDGNKFLRIDIEHGWPIDLNAKAPKIFDDETAPAEELTEYSSCITVFESSKGPAVLLVRNGPDKNTKGNIPVNTTSSRFGFPGGQVDFGETPIEGGCRETFEETGLTVEIINNGLPIYTETQGNHTKYFYISRIIGGEIKQGDEIAEIEVRLIASLADLAQMGYLRASHRKAFEKFLEWRESR